MINSSISWPRRITGSLLLPLLLAACSVGEDTARDRGAGAAPDGAATPGNPLETLAQSHAKRSGISVGEARQAAARQLGIPVADLRDYQNQPEVTLVGTQGIGDNARTAAALLDKGLVQSGQSLLRVGSDVADESPRLVSLNFKNATNYEFYLDSTDGTANAAGQLRWDPVYGGLIKGNPRTLDNARICHESVNGFNYTGREDYQRTRGNPARIEISGSNKLSSLLQGRGVAAGPTPKVALFEFTFKEQDISNRSMADFVRELQANEHEFGSVVHSLFTLNPKALGASTFPPGSRFYVHWQTHFAKAGGAQAMAGFQGTVDCRSENDLDKPRDTLGAFMQPVRVRHSINATAWNAMKSALNIP